MEEEHPGSKFHFSLSKWLEKWPSSLTGRRTRGWTCKAGTGNVWEFPGVSKMSEESLGQPVRPGTALSTRIWSFLSAKTVELRGGEGPLTVVTDVESENKSGRVGGWGGNGAGPAVLGVAEAKKEFCYNILSAAFCACSKPSTDTTPPKNGKAEVKERKKFEDKIQLSKTRYNFPKRQKRVTIWSRMTMPPMMTLGNDFPRWLLTSWSMFVFVFRGIRKKNNNRNRET